MTYLTRKFFRELRENMAQILTVTIIIAIGISFFIGLTYTYNSLNTSIDNYYKSYNLADMYVYGQQISSTDVVNLKQNSKIRTVEEKIQLIGTLTESELVINSTDTNSQINQVKYLLGEAPEYEEIAVDQNYFKENNLKINDKIKVTINNQEYLLTISGTIRSPQYMYLVKDSSQPVPNHKEYGYSVMSLNYLQNILPISLNLVEIKTKDSTNINSLKDDITDMNETYSVVTKTNNSSYAMVRNKLDTIKSMSTLLPIIFFVLAIIITLISMSRSVENQRSQIAIMKALGFGNRTIISSFLYVPFITSIIGTVVGTIIGVLIFPNLLIDTLEILFDFPTLTYENFIFLSIGSFLIVLTIEILATIFSCRKILKEIPAEALRPKPPKKAAHSIIEKIPIIWKNLSYENKLVIRNISMNRKRFLLSSIGIIFSASIMMASFGLKFALQDIIETEFSTIRNYDISASLNVTEKPDSIYLQSKKIKKSDAYSIAQIQIDNKDTKLNVVNQNSSSLSLTNTSNNKINFNKSSGVYLSKKLANELHVKKNDTIKLIVNIPGAEKEILSAKVADLYTSYTSQGVYTTFEYLKKQGINYPVQSLLIQTDSVTEVESDLKNNEEIANVTIKENQKSDYIDASQSIDKMVLLMILASALLLFTVVYNIGSINIFERSRDIATEKVLGLLNSEINKLVLKENLILVLFSSIIGTVLSFSTYQLLCTSLAPEDMSFPNNLNIMSIPISIVMIFFFMFLTNLFLKNKISKISMLDSLKSVE
jgi:putative ABC transport system permease protein